MSLIICQKQSFADVLQKKFHKNFTNFTGKHLCVTGLSPISQKAPVLESLFLVKLAKFLRTLYFTEHFRWLLLVCLLFKSQSFKDLTVQFQLCLLLLATPCILLKETITRTISSVIARSTKKAF